MKLRTIIIAILAIASIQLWSCKGGGEEVDPGTSEEMSEKTSSYDASILAEYTALQLQLITNTPGYSGPVAARSIGYLSLAAYEATVHGIEEHQSLAGQLQGSIDLPTPEKDKKYDWALAANAAQHTLMRQLYATSADVLKGKMDTLRKNFEAKYSPGVGTDAIERSINFGNEIALAIWEYAKTDGGHEAWNANFPTSNSQISGSSKWQPTSTQKRPLLPNWKNVRPFLSANDQLAIDNPAEFSFNVNSDFFSYAQQVYITANNLSTAQNEIMNFWDDPTNASFTPAGHQLAVVAKLAAKEGYNLQEAVLLLLKVGIASHDAYVSAYQTKYAKNIMRPETYIKQAIDPQWEELISGTPSPSYTSAQATISSAIAEILTAEFGENYIFEDDTKGSLAPKRGYKGFTEYAKEARMAQVYAGNQYLISADHGNEQGKKIASNVMNLQLLAPMQSDTTMAYR
ncbi:phosphoesterase [Jiulongibacter sp. NS-SX5]|uniref:phosphoesterase n=1 Tax=Jiulongibacter sp. NS-SX5 TaxID=3463854 RepID=UPI004059B54F